MTAPPLPSNVLAHWTCNLGRSFTCRVINSDRLFCEVTTAQGEAFILKEVGDIEPRAGERQKKVETDLALLRHLAARGVPVALPVLTGEGRPYVQSGDRFFTLSPVLTDHFNHPTARPGMRYRNLGIALARLHKALVDYPGEICSWTIDLPRRVLDEAVPVLQKHLDKAGWNQLEKAINGLRAPVNALLSDLPAQHIHGDCHGGNVLFDGECVSGFIDLDHLPVGPRVYDLGYFLADWVKNRTQNPLEIDTWFAILAELPIGYAQEIPLSFKEKQAIPYIMLATQLIFAAWFFEPLGKPALALFNLHAFYWMEENLLRIQSVIEGS